MLFPRDKLSRNVELGLDGGGDRPSETWGKKKKYVKGSHILSLRSQHWEVREEPVSGGKSVLGELETKRKGKGGKKKAFLSSRASMVAQMVRNLPAVWETQV